MLTAQKPNKGPRINYALAATLLASGATLAQAAEASGAANATALRVCMARKGVTITSIRKDTHTVDRIRTVATRAVSEASEALRSQFGEILAKHGEALAKVPSKRNLKHIKQVGEAFEPLARIGKIVHDWGNSSVSGLVVMGDVPEVDAPAIEVQGAAVAELPAPQEPGAVGGS